MRPQRLCIIHRIDVEKILRIEAQRCMDEMVQLQRDDESRCEHDDGQHILNDDEHLAEHHFGTETERAFHDVQRLKARNLPRRNHARKNTQ